MHMDNTFIRFILVGLSNTMIGMSIIYIAWHFLQLGDLVSNLLGYAVGFVWSFGMNRLWTFHHHGPVMRSFWRFAAVCAAAYAANLLVLFSARSYLGPESFLPHVLGVVIYTLIGYLGSRYFAFRKSAEPALADAADPI